MIPRQNRVIRTVCLLILLLVVSGLITQAQEAQPKRGFHVGGGFSFSDIETINTTNGNLMLNIPLASLPPGRGSVGGGLNLFYNSKLYNTHIENVQDLSGVVTSQNLLQENYMSGGWHYGYDYYLKVTNRNNDDGGPYQCAPTAYESQRVAHIWKVQIVYPDGSEKEFRPTGHNDYFSDGYFNISPYTGQITQVSWGSLGEGSYACNVSNTQASLPLTYYSTDGSYTKLTIQANGWTLSFPDGGRVTDLSDEPQTIYDRNGNYVTLANAFLEDGMTPVKGIIDAFGRFIGIEHNGLQDKIHSRRINNEGVIEEVITFVNWKLVEVYRNYRTTAASAGRERGGTSIQLLETNFLFVDQIILPTQGGGLTYTFGYNPGTSNPSNGWGEISSVTLPTGATTSYTYERDMLTTTAPTCRQVMDNSPETKTLTYQTSYDGLPATVNETWHYGIGNSVSTVVEPDGGLTTQYYYDTTTGSKYSGLVYKTIAPDGKVTESTWQFNYPAGANTSANINAYLKTQYISTDGLAKTAIKDFNYDKNGNLTQTIEYDWVNYDDVPRSFGAPTGIPATAADVIKRVTVNTYVNATPDASNTTYIDEHSYDQSTSQPLRTAQESSETRSGIAESMVQSRTEFSYDDASTKGNLTGQRSWDSTKTGGPGQPIFMRPLQAGSYVSTSNQYADWGGGATGKLTQSTDANGNVTKYFYENIGNNVTDLYVTRTIVADNALAIRRTSESKYDFQTGLVIESKDTDNNILTKTTYDVFGRPTLIQNAFGTPVERRTATEYSDANRRIITRADLNAAGDGKLVSVEHYDQLGRIRLSRTLEDVATQSPYAETDGIKIQTRYFNGDENTPNGYDVVSSPYRAATSAAASGESGMAWRRTKFDDSGRVAEMETFAGATVPFPWLSSGGNTNSTGKVITTYDAEFSAVTDQAGNQRRTQLDGLGRLVRVDEPDATTGNLGSTTSPVQPTHYTYNALDKLTQTVQGSQTRTFVYSSLTRLISATNPENGTISYSYDDNGNLLSRTDANNTTLTYTYDALNRNLSVDYSNTPVAPDITRTYDNPAANTYGKGKLWKTYAGGNETVGTDVDGMTIHRYDALGRADLKEQRFKVNGMWQPVYSLERSFNLAGNVTLLRYPSGHTTGYHYDSAGRLSSFEGSLGDNAGRTYSNEMTYNPSGQMGREHFATTIPLYHHRAYNSRLQLKTAVLGTNATDSNVADRGRLNFFYTANARNGGNPNTIADSGSDNNGSVRVAQHIVPTGAGNWVVQHDLYDYDKLNRLEQVTGIQRTETGSGNINAYVQKFDYDRWGNRSINQADSGVTWPQHTININKFPCQVSGTNTNNRLTGSGSCAFIYDSAGNVTHDPSVGQTYSYDAENRLLSASGVATTGGQYAYNAEGQRTRFRANIHATQPRWKYYVYGFDGELVAEYPLQAAPESPETEYGFRNGQRLIIAKGSTVQGPGGTVINQPVTNGGFETPNIGSGGYQLNPPNALWDFIGLSGIAANGSQMTAGNGASPEGSQSAFLQGSSEGSPSTISQLVSGFDTRRAYQLTFKAAAKAPPGGTKNGEGNVETAIVEVFFNDLSLGVYQFTSTSYGAYATPQFSAPRGKGTIKFVSRNPRENAVALLDDIRLTGLAPGTNNADIRWLVTDHLGTARMVAELSGRLDDDQSTSSVREGITRHDYLPFGEELVANGQTPLRNSGLGYGDDGIRQKFTSKERDTETGLDFFEARYYSSVQGRFTSPDEFTGGPDELYDFADMASDNPTFYADILDPQSLNKYQYCYNDPLSTIDIDGHKGWRERLSYAIDGLVDYANGVAKGVVNSVSQGTLSDVYGPKTSDSLINRIGQGVGSAATLAIGVELTKGGIAISGTGVGILVGAPAAAIGVGSVVGGATNLGKVIGTPINSSGPRPSNQTLPQTQVQPLPPPVAAQSSKPKSKQKKERSLEGAQDQHEGISKAQDTNRKRKRPDKIRSIRKSEQDLDQQLKKIKSSKDIE